MSRRSPVCESGELDHTTPLAESVRRVRGTRLIARRVLCFRTYRYGGIAYVGGGGGRENIRGAGVDPNATILS